MPQLFGEIGKSGLDEDWFGHLTTAYISELYWPDAYTIYNEMRRRDPTLRSILNAVRMLARQADWKAEAPTDKGPDKDAAEFVDSCLADMSHTAEDFVDDALTCLPFGWASSEICYKRRQGDKGRHTSKFTDGKIGWRKFAFRRQSTFDHWAFDDSGGLQGWYQRAAPDFTEVLLPIEKLLHFTCERDGNNPEGISLFESAYEPWHYVTNLQIIGGIGWQRAFVGLPVFTFTEAMSSTDLDGVKTVGQGLVVDEKQYVSVPPGVTFELATTDAGSATPLLEWIRFFRIQMAQLVMADFLFLGSGNTGSWALGSDKTSLFLMAVNGYLDRVADVWSRFGVERLFQYNPAPGISELPRITHSVVRKPNLPELGEFLQRIAPLITLGDEDELWVREQSGMPEIDLEELQRRREEQEAKAAEIAAQTQPQPQEDGQPPPPETGEEPGGEGNLSEFADPELTEGERARRRIEDSIRRDVQRFLDESEGPLAAGLPGWDVRSVVLGN